MSFRVLLLCALVACGRYGFSSVPDGDGGNSTGDGRPADSSMPVDAMPLVDCHIANPTAFFCDSFEGPMLDTWDYDVVMNGRVEATDHHAFRGTKALEIESFDVNDYKSARWGVFYDTPVTAGDYYLRAWYWITSGTVWQDQASILSTGNSTDPYPSTYVMYAPGEVHLSVDNNSFVTDNDVPRDRWFCLQLHIFVDPVIGQVTLNVDSGPPIMTVPTDSYVDPTGYTGVDVGLHYATPAQGPVTMWIDEVVADTSPIACN